jgi:hypothetical protein
MATIQADPMVRDALYRGTIAEQEYERGHHWPVNWSGVFVGALAALAVGLVIGVVAIAVGAHVFDANSRVIDLKKLTWTAVGIGVCGTFFSFVIGGWIAGKIAGALRAEHAMLHGAIVFLVAVPLMAVADLIGAGGLAGSWVGSLAGSAGLSAMSSAAAPFEKPEDPGATASDEAKQEYTKSLDKYKADVKQWKEETPKAVRNTALFSVTAMMLALVGSVIGGWIASGEPMTFTHHVHRAHAARAP